MELATPATARSRLDAGPLSSEDARLVRALRAGDEQAFAAFVDAHGASLLRVAMLFVSSRAVAEEVVQEAWVGFLTGLDRFEGRSSLRTWLFRILANVAKTRAVRESRTLPFSSLGEPTGDEPAVDPSRFRGDGDRWAGHWASAPVRWDDLPEGRLLAEETLALVAREIASLPAGQRAVISLRDVEGWSSDEVCELLSISEGNQRVLLHRARSRLRAALEAHLAEPEPLGL